MAATIETLRAVHHPTRRRIIDYLKVHGPSQVGTLARALDQQVGSISHHLRMLERADVVERAGELQTDGRTSWWRLCRLSLTWAPDDFETASDRFQARVAEKANAEHHFGRLAQWMRTSESASEEWRRGAFAADFVVAATPDELEEIGALLAETVHRWRDRVEARADDGATREATMIFMHGFRFRP